MMLRAAVFSVLLCLARSHVIQTSFNRTEQSSGNSMDGDEFSVSALLEKANRNIGETPGAPLVLYGDIAVPTGLQNADPCVGHGCLWPKYSDGLVYVPYRISQDYSSRERSIIQQGLQSFAQSTCIRFIPRTWRQDYVDIKPLDGCFSYIGRQRGNQTVSLNRQGCIYYHVIQHELLHALGFDHEQCRSDRDQYVRILWENIEEGKESNFEIRNTYNLNTPYDYNSVMHYAKNLFSWNGWPTILPIPDPNVPIGLANQMSHIDILRVNRLYRCGNQEETSD